MKKVLLNTPSQFTEWLIQMRLVRAVQFCPSHPVNFSGAPRQLRLGMFTDTDKLAQSGGPYRREGRLAQSGGQYRERADWGRFGRPVGGQD